MMADVRTEDKEEVKGKQVGKIKDSNHNLTYGKNWKEEDKGWCLIVDGSWKKVMQGTKEEWEAYGWALMEKGHEVECGGEKIYAMSSLQTETNAILKSLQIILPRRIEKLEIWTDYRNIITWLLILLSPLGARHKLEQFYGT